MLQSLGKTVCFLTTQDGVWVLHHAVKHAHKQALVKLGHVITTCHLKKGLMLLQQLDFHWKSFLTVKRKTYRHREDETEGHNLTTDVSEK